MKQKLKVQIVMVSNREKLTRELDRGSMAICIIGDLYDEMHKMMKKSATGKTLKKVGTFGAVGGFLLGGPIGWAALAIGAVVGAVGGHGDKMKEYFVSVDEVSKRIFLIKIKGANRYIKSKHELC